MYKLALLATALAASAVEARTITLRNQCNQPIWPAFYTGNTANGVPQGDTGFMMNAGDVHPLYVPDSWAAARIWARNDCDFSKQDVQACASGSCIGGLACTQPGIPPVTLAEFTLAQGGQDNYDVSNVDGSNLPVNIVPSDGSCATGSCAVDLNANCPDNLRYVVNGQTVGCKSGCLATGSETDCCSGSHNTPATCPSSGVSSYAYFHDNCPNAVSLIGRAAVKGPLLTIHPPFRSTPTLTTTRQDSRRATRRPTTTSSSALN